MPHSHRESIETSLHCIHHVDGCTCPEMKATSGASLHPIVKRSSYTSSVYESAVTVTNKQSNNRTNEWRPFFLYNVHTSYNKVLLCFTTRDHACHFLSAVKLDMTWLPTLLIVFDMRAWCRLILEVSLLLSGPFWYSFWSSSRRLDTWKIKEERTMDCLW
jgi:hypothetical protein